MQGRVCTPLSLASSRLSDGRRIHFSAPFDALDRRISSFDARLSAASNVRESESGTVCAGFCSPSSTRRECFRLCPRAGVTFSIFASKLVVMLPLNRSQPCLKNLNGFQFIHHTRPIAINFAVERRTAARQTLFRLLQLFVAQCTRWAAFDLSNDSINSRTVHIDPRFLRDVEDRR
jgi:hypothetical protein